jgi:tRNA threonylcarbamoyl adenosine modification protein YeaZ
VLVLAVDTSTPAVSVAVVDVTGSASLAVGDVTGSASLAVGDVTGSASLAVGDVTASASVAVGDVTDSATLALRRTVAANQHGELLAPLVDDALRAAGVGADRLDVIAVGVGPGPFTGLRVGLVTAAALGDALSLPVAGVCSLDAVAFAGERPWAEGFTVVTDARRREVYWARYADWRRVEGPSVDAPATVAAKLAAGSTVVGAGALLHRECFSDCVVDESDPYPDPVAIATLSRREDWTLPVRPLYLRRPDAKPPAGPKRVTP